MQVQECLKNFKSHPSRAFFLFFFTVCLNIKFVTVKKYIHSILNQFSSSNVGDLSIKYFIYLVVIFDLFINIICDTSSACKWCCGSWKRSRVDDHHRPWYWNARVPVFINTHTCYSIFSFEKYLILDYGQKIPSSRITTWFHFRSNSFWKYHSHWI